MPYAPSGSNRNIRRRGRRMSMLIRETILEKQRKIGGYN
jgi:hypothetical protein